MTDISPLAAVNPDSLTALFAADPLTLTDDSKRSMIIELRRRRSAFLAEEAAKSLKPKRERAAPIKPSADSALGKPIGELDLDDL